MVHGFYTIWLRNQVLPSINAPPTFIPSWAENECHLFEVGLGSGNQDNPPILLGKTENETQTPTLTRQPIASQHHEHRHLIGCWLSLTFLYYSHHLMVHSIQFSRYSFLLFFFFQNLVTNWELIWNFVIQHWINNEERFHDVGLCLWKRTSWCSPCVQCCFIEAPGLPEAVTLRCLSLHESTLNLQ